MQRAQVKPTTTVLDADAAFGSAVGIAKDGTRTIVAAGAPGLTTSGGKKGGVLLFDSNGSTWSEVALRTCGSGGPPFTQTYGSTLALSPDGMILAIGSATSLSPICRFRGPTTWTSDTNINLIDRATALSALGHRLAVGIAKPSSGIGRVEIFYRDPSTGWTQEGTVTDNELNSEFGASVSLGDSGGMLVVGAPRTLSGSSNPKGKVHSYQAATSASPWQPAQHHSQTFASSSDFDRFGAAVAANPGNIESFAAGPDNDRHGDRAGRIIRFKDSWMLGDSSFRELLYCDDTRSGESFGQALALMDNQGPLVVGAPRNDDLSARAGAVHLLSFDSTIKPAGYLQRARLLPSSIGVDSNAGSAIAVHTSGKIIVGGPGHASAAGAAWIYEGTSTPFAYAEKVKLTSPTSNPGDRFGASVAIGDDMAVVGAPAEGTKGASAGRVYTYFRSPQGTWTAGPELVGSDTAAGDGFGSALVLAGTRLYVSAPDHDSAAQDGGAIYVFEINNKVVTQSAKLTQVSSGALLANDRLGAKLVGDETTVIARRGTQNLQVYALGNANTFAPQAGLALGATIGGLSLYLDGLLVGLPSATQAELWTRSGGSWTKRHSFAPPTGTPHDSPSAEYGSAVALGRYHAFVAAPFAPAAPNEKPRVFAYSLVSERSVRGDPCGVGTECLNGTCVDGVCCAATCGDCETCNCDDAAVCAGTLGVAGVCQPRAIGNTGGSCQAPKLCDGKGSCVSVIAIGQACKAGDVCALGVAAERTCLHGVCCKDESCGPCTRCDVPSKEGSCAPTPLGSTDTQCQGSNACNGKGKCLLADGESCNNDSECASDHCVDGLCCDTSCDKTCESCKVAGSVGSCTPVPVNTDPDGECLGKDPSCGGACDGQRQCEFPGGGTKCGLCQACDGTGQCAIAPEDDDACGSIDCDQLDTTCRDYIDLESRRCASFGKCKVANDPASCTNYSALQCDAGPTSPDAGPTSPDAGQKGSASDGGCALAHASSSTDLPFALLIGLLIWRRRRRAYALRASN